MSARITEDSDNSERVAGSDASPCYRELGTPETDRAVKASNGQWSFVLRDASRELERLLLNREEEILQAIEILDGQRRPINWRDKSHPELLRKLCEHLESKCGVSCDNAESSHRT